MINVDPDATNSQSSMIDDREEGNKKEKKEKERKENEREAVLFIVTMRLRTEHATPFRDEHLD